MARLGSVAAAPFVGDTFASLYLGNERVPTVPGKPVVGQPVVEIQGGEAPIDYTAIFFFNNPANDGGSEITDYKVFVDGQEVTPDEISDNVVFDFVVTLAEPAPGSSVQVSAVNAVGEGPRSDPLFLPTANVPGAPVISAASIDGGEFLDITGDAPSNDGGSAIARYNLYVNGNFYMENDLEFAGWDFGGEASPIELGDEIRISAVNAIGEGPLSNPVTVT